ncbi:MAG: hypothetical protein IT445_04950 [Phycisphaeraceae bacterium]|nr:hypothetical protein [Phycisphaeraceae bacterium]
MCRWTYIMVAGSVLAGVLLAAGCASTSGGSTASKDMHSNMQGMMCPNCETVWVKDRSQPGSKIVSLRHKTQMTCPDCDAMATSQLMEDGKVMLHNCPTCKVTPESLTQSAPPDRDLPRK